MSSMLDSNSSYSWILNIHGVNVQLSSCIFMRWASSSAERKAIVKKAHDVPDMTWNGVQNGSNKCLQASAITWCDHPKPHWDQCSGLSLYTF